MDDEQKKALIEKALQNIKNSQDKKESLAVFFKLMGVDDRIITNPNPENLGTGIDFDSFITSLIGGKIEITEGQISISAKYGTTYLVREGREVAGIESTILVKNGQLFISSAYQNLQNEMVVHNTSIATVEMPKGHRVRTKTDDYKLTSNFNQANNKTETNGFGFIEIKDYDESGMEVERHGISIHNNPTIPHPSIKDAKEQFNYLNNSVLQNNGNIKDIPINVPAINVTSMNTRAFVNTEYWDVRKSIDEVQNAVYDSKEQQWKIKYSLPVTGEHSISIIRNNSERYDSEEDLKKVQQERMEEGFYDKKIEQYKNRGITGKSIAQQLEQRKIELEQLKGRTL